MKNSEYAVMYACEEKHGWYQALRSLLRHSLRGVNPQRVLDIGCGTGFNLLYLSRLLPKASLTGIDFHPQALDFCRSRNTGAVLLQGSANRLPVASESFDLAICMDVLSQTELEERPALQECHRALKRGGRLILNVPAFECLRGAHDEVVSTRRRYRRGMLREKLQAAGFSVRSLFYWNALFLPAFFIQRRLGRASSGESDLKIPPPFWNQVLRAGLRFEEILSTRGLLPFGTSLFAVCEKV